MENVRGEKGGRDGLKATQVVVSGRISLAPAHLNGGLSTIPLGKFHHPQGHTL